MKIHQIRNIFPNIDVARYNVAVWQRPNEDALFFIGREVTQPAQHGEPDVGVLKLFEVAPHGRVIQEKILWMPLHDGLSLEDPRALEVADETLIIGLTAVLRNKSGHPVPFPTIVNINSLHTWQRELPPVLIIDTFGPGKNLTPLDNHTYVFRPEDELYNHKLLVFSLHSQVPKKLSDISFPIDLHWAQWRIGTTMSPIWITPTEALFIIHGITIQEFDGHKKYVYSIGRAKLTRNGDTYSVIVAPEPIITPDDFLDAQGVPLINELHPDQRRVVYSCGGVIKNNNPERLSLYVNVGDRSTFEVDFLLSELKEGLF